MTVYFPGDDILDYLFFSLVEVPFKLKDEDLCHAISPIDSIMINKRKSVVTIHDLMLLRIPSLSFPDIILSNIAKLFFKKAMDNAVNCEKIITVSEQTANDLSNFYPVNLDEICVVRQVIADYLFPKHVHSDSYTIGTISNINNRKRVDILIKSFLKADIRNCKLFDWG